MCPRQVATSVASFHTALDFREMPWARLSPTWLWHESEKPLRWAADITPLLGKSLLSTFTACFKSNHPAPRAYFPETHQEANIKDNKIFSIWKESLSKKAASNSVSEVMSMSCCFDALNPPQKKKKKKSRAVTALLRHNVICLPMNRLGYLVSH